MMKKNIKTIAIKLYASIYDVQFHGNLCFCEQYHLIQDNKNSL